MNKYLEKIAGLAFSATSGIKSVAGGGSSLATGIKNIAAVKPTANLPALKLPIPKAPIAPVSPSSSRPNLSAMKTQTPIGTINTQTGANTNLMKAAEVIRSTSGMINRYNQLTRGRVGRVAKLKSMSLKPGNSFKKLVRADNRVRRLSNQIKDRAISMLERD